MAFDAQGNWKPDDDSVATRVTALTSKDSPIMQQARGSAMKTANRRGLMNSTMAARAGEDSAISAALPIASQDASQTNQKNLQYMQDKMTVRGQDLQKELGYLSDTTQRRGQDVSADVSRRGQDFDYSATTRGQDMSYATTTRGQDLDFGATTRGQDISREQGLLSNDTTRRGQDLDMQKTQIAATADVAKNIVSLNDTYSQMFASIMGNEKMSDTARSNYLASAKAQTQTMQSLVTSIAGGSLSWGSSTPSASAPPSPSAPVPIPAASGAYQMYQR